MTETSIDVSIFRAWQKDPVTQCMMLKLQEAVAEIDETMLHADTIMSEDSIKHLCRLLGQKEVLTMIINVEPSDLIGDTKNETKTDL